MYFTTSRIRRGWLENPFCHLANVPEIGINALVVWPLVVYWARAGATSLRYPDTNCGWLKMLLAWNHAVVLKPEKQLHPSEPLADFCMHAE
jgi:hypothetical protein